MEIKIKKEEFQKALSLTQNVVEKKSTMPILANVLLETKSKSLRLAATDLEVGVSVDCAADVVKDGKITVLAKELFDIIKELSNDVVHLVTSENNWLEIDCGKSHFKIVATGADEFPAIPTIKDGTLYVEEKNVLLGMVDKVSYAMSMDETRYNLNGICLQCQPETGTIRFVATDGHRLSVVERNSKSKWKIKNDVIIPRKGILELKKLLENRAGDFSIKADDKNISIEKDNVQLVIRLIEGQFPPYEQVVPKNNKRLAIVEKGIFTQALRRVSLMASDKTRGVKFAFSPGHLEISTNNPDVGEANEEIDVTYKGETFSVGFNAKYFLEVLNVIEDQKIVLELKDDVSPCLIRSEFDKGLTNVIMPMRM